MVIAIAGFLPTWLIDTATVFGVGGTVATLYGLYLTWRQVLLTKQAAEAARDAAVESEQRMRRQYVVFLIGDSHRSLSEIVVHVDHEDWHSAALRMSDLAEKMGLLGQLMDQDSFPATELASDFHTWSQVARKRAAGEDRHGFSEKKWLTLVQRLQRHLDELRGPFAQMRGE